MRTLVALLAVTSLGFAASIVYLARELEVSRSAANTGSATPSARLPVAHSMRVPVIASTGNSPDGKQASTGTEAAVASEDMKTTARKWLVSQIPTMRALLEDSQKRAAAMRDVGNNFRKGYPRLAGHLGLTADEYARLEDLVVDQQFRELDARYRCALEPACDYLPLGAEMQSAKDQELADLLGSEKAQQFKTYQDNMQERSSVTYLRGQLPDSMSLSDGQAEKLVAVLGDERRRISEEFEQRGAGVQARLNTLGSVVISTTAAGIDQKLAEAAEFQRRQRERAAQVLTAAQLKEFTRIQEDLLDGMRQGLEYEEEIKAVKPR